MMSVPHCLCGGEGARAGLVNARLQAALSLVVTAGMGKPQSEQGECLGASAVPVPRWPRDGQHWESTHSHVTKHPKEPTKFMATTGL